MKSAFPASLCFENVCHEVDEEHKLLANSPQPTNALASSSKMSIPDLFLLVYFLSKQAIEKIKSKRKHVPFTLKRKINDFFLTLIKRWLSTLLGILCKYLDKSTTGTFMKPANDFK